MIAGRRPTRSRVAGRVGLTGLKGLKGLKGPAARTVSGVLAVATLAACTSGTAPGEPAAGSSSAPVAGSPSAVTPSSSSPSSTVPSSTEPGRVSSSVAPRSSPVAVTVASSTPPPRSTCRSVMTRVIRGSADRGREFAALQFTNTGTARCTLVGYPVVTLRRDGRTIGTPSQPAGSATSSFVLAPGATAESRLDDYTDCQAPLSDAIHVVVPGSTQNITRPGELRACTLRVSPLGRPQ